MKYVVLVAVFGVMPYLLFANLVMPALDSLKAVYSNADVISQQAVSYQAPTNQ